MVNNFVLIQMSCHDMDLYVCDKVFVYPFRFSWYKRNFCNNGKHSVRLISSLHISRFFKKTLVLIHNTLLVFFLSFFFFFSTFSQEVIRSKSSSSPLEIVFVSLQNAADISSLCRCSYSRHTRVYFNKKW